MAVNFSNKYPYTDYHELNLEWVIKEVKYWSEKVGKTIQSIELTGSAGLVDTYTINYSDGTTSTFDVTNGNGITSIEKTDTAGLVDTYTVTFTDGSTTEFYVRNGAEAIDPTLTLSDYAADAKAAGDMIRANGDMILANKQILDDISLPRVEGISSIESHQGYIIRNDGSSATTGVLTYYIVKYPVTPGKTYWITASANWGNCLWCFYSVTDTVVQIGQTSANQSAFTSISDEETIAPAGAEYILIAYNSNVQPSACKTVVSYIPTKWNGKKWVCVGDSLTAENIRTSIHYFDYIAGQTGLTVVNMGVSGSGYARLRESNQAFYQRISACPADADVVTIFGSFNDLGAGLPIGSVSDNDESSIAGCINKTIDNLQAVIPLVNLGIIAPTPWNTTQPATSGQAYDYVEMLKAICEHRSIPFLDLWRCSNLRPWDADFRDVAYTHDGGNGTHPDENGHKLIAPRFMGFLESLLLPF